MLRFVVKFCFAILLCNASSPPASRRNYTDIIQPTTHASYPANTEDPRVFSGKQTSHKLFPFAVSMLLYSQRFRQWNYNCGGSLISHTAVLTAAHCVVVLPSNAGAKCFPVSAQNLYVVAGTDYVWRGSPFGQKSQAKSIHVHPSCYFFMKAILSFDAAVVTLQHLINYNEQVQPLKLFSSDAGNNMKEFDRIAKAKTTCYVVGYGQISSRSILSDYIQSGDMTLMTNSECQQTLCTYLNKYYCTLDFKSTAWSCAATLKSTPCKGDSGGPLVCNGFVFGTVSWGMGCFSDVGNPAIFGDMTAVTDMVNLYTGKQQARRAANASVHYQALPTYYTIIILLALLMSQK